MVGAASGASGGPSYELDLVARRSNVLVFCEVKSKRDSAYGEPVEAVSREKQRRLRQAAETWLAARPELAALEVRFDVLGERAGRVERLANAFS